jgi:hypothetical protein
MKIIFFSMWFDHEPTFKGLILARKLLREGLLWTWFITACAERCAAQGNEAIV